MFEAILCVCKVLADLSLLRAVRMKILDSNPKVSHTVLVGVPQYKNPWRALAIAHQ